jgi:hypothetical protein
MVKFVIDGRVVLVSKATKQSAIKALLTKLAFKNIGHEVHVEY